MTSRRRAFGALVRREREAKEIGLREMASFLRSANGLTAEQMAHLAAEANKAKEK